MSEHTRGRDASVVAPEADGATGRARDEPKIEALWRRYKASGEEALRERLILHYSPLVKYVAGRVRAGLPPSVDPGDCVSYGIFGLIDAIEKYDPARSRFEPYAVRRIRGAILDELRALDWIPRSVRGKARALEQAYTALEARLHRTPSERQIAAEMGVSLSELHQIFSQLALVNVLALDELLQAAGDRPGGISLVDRLRDLTADDPAQVFESQETRERLAGAIRALPARERSVITLYYFEGLTLAEIGRALQVSESRVSQLHTKAMLQLRAKLVEPSD